MRGAQHAGIAGRERQGERFGKGGFAGVEPAQVGAAEAERHGGIGGQVDLLAVEGQGQHLGVYKRLNIDAHFAVKLPLVKVQALGMVIIKMGYRHFWPTRLKPYYVTDYNGSSGTACCFNFDF